MLHQRSSQSKCRFSQFADDLQQKLTPLQYKVTQENGTEPPFKNEYWDNKEAGIYVDIVSGEPLFSSTQNSKSGTGWPSFYQAIEDANIKEVTDGSLFMTRVEVRSKNADSHLGHLFNDGPEPTEFMPLHQFRFSSICSCCRFGEGKFGTISLSIRVQCYSTKTETAILAGGCFGEWNKFYVRFHVMDVVVGYTGGKPENLPMKMSKQGTTNHAESVKIIFDTSRISYEDILEYFFVCMIQPH